MFGFLGQKEQYDIRENLANEADWFTISKKYTLSDDLIREWKDIITDWNSICMKQKMGPKLLEEIIPYLDSNAWLSFCIYQNLSEEFIDRWADRIDWKNLSFNPYLTEKVAKKYYHKLNKNYLLINDHFSKDFKLTIQHDVIWDK